MKHSAQIHRFGDRIACYVGTGATVYLTQAQARKLARGLNGCARNIKEQPRFSQSEFITVHVDDVSDSTYE